MQLQSTECEKGEIVIMAISMADLRKERKMTQEDLAEKVGLTKGAIGMYETDKRKPDYDTLLKFADIFNVSTDFLLSHTVSDNLQNENPSSLSDPLFNKLFSTFALLDEDNKDILIGKAKELLKQQRLEEKRRIIPTAKAT